VAIKKKPVLRKPLAGKAGAPRPKAVPEAEAPQQGDDTELQPPASDEADDELALQEMPEIAYPGEAFKRPRKKAPVQNTGTSLDIGDTSKLLIIAWCVMGAVVAISVYLLLVHSSNSDQETRNATPAPVAAPPKAVPPKVDPKDAHLQSNPGNRAAAEAYFKFGKWAYTEATDWDGPRLTERFNTDVSLNNVDDPDIRELCKLQLENFALVKDHPLRPFESVGGAGIETKRGTDSANIQSYKTNENKIKALTLAIRNRYGFKL
jgi:hypothetical protein